MKIKITGAGMTVTLTVDYRSWTPADDPWTVSKKGIIGADKGHWVRGSSFGGGYSILFYADGVSDVILTFDQVTRFPHGNPFKKGQTGYGTHDSVSGVMPTGATVEWEVLSM